MTFGANRCVRPFVFQAKLANVAETVSTNDDFPLKIWRNWQEQGFVVPPPGLPKCKLRVMSNTSRSVSSDNKDKKDDNENRDLFITNNPFLP
jgi:hypothetical protein